MTSRVRANWFFAFPIDGRFVERLPPQPPSIRRFHPEDVHLTLAFLGACGEGAAERGLAALDLALQSARPTAVDVSLSGVVPMGPAREYSALSALLERGRQSAEQLILALRDPIHQAAGGRPERRPPKPHVTIARPARRASSAERQAGVTWAAALDLRGVAAKLEQIVLYTWSDGDRRDRLFRGVAERRLATFVPV